MEMPTLRLSGAVMDGAENIFLVVDGLSAAPIPNLHRPDLVRKCAQNRLGLALDGVVFLDPARDVDFAWDFYNSDGSSAEFCGNAARCVTRFFHDRVYQKPTIRFSTLAGVVDGSLSASGSPRVRLPGKAELACEEVVVPGVSDPINFVMAGVPHLIIEGAPEVKIASELRKPNSLRPGGANVTFVQNVAGQWRVVTFERGVEGFTRACGSGAIAAACFLREKRGAGQQITLQFPGGQLVVDFVDQAGIYLSGPVRYQFSVQMEIP